MYDAEQDKPDDQKHDYMATEDQLVEMKIIKSVWSTNQLFEKVHDVWSAYVHVPIGDKTRLLTADYDRTVVRRYTFGRFSDMLQAMIFHPAMLTYLDQPQSNGNAKQEDGRPAINENLGRELLELFSIGALDPITGKPNYDGRLDVVQSAYALTGLTVDRDTLTYKFDPDMRYRGPLKVMTWKHPNTDPAQGVAVIKSLVSYLAHHPATARTIATAFARHFVSDTPRPELIAKLAAEFTKAGTDIKPMLRALFASEDFRKSVGPEVPHRLGVPGGDAAGHPGRAGRGPAGRDRAEAGHLPGRTGPAVPGRAGRRRPARARHPGRAARLPGGVAVRQGHARPLEPERHHRRRVLEGHQGPDGHRAGQPCADAGPARREPPDAAHRAAAAAGFHHRPAPVHRQQRRPRRPHRSRTCRPCCVRSCPCRI